MVLPDVLRRPGSWEPAFPATPGRLSAVGVGERAGLLSSTSSLWGVSAATGETRWLDLPDLVPASHVPPELSADGRRVAYWVTGPTSGEPLGNSGPTRRGETEEVTPVVGVAVLDLATGEVTRWEIASEHGLSVNGLAWAGDVLWWMGGPVTPSGEGGASAELATYTWDVTTDERVEVERRGRRRRARPCRRSGDAPGGFVTLPRTFRLEQVTGAQAPESLAGGAPGRCAVLDRAGRSRDGARRRDRRGAPVGRPHDVRRRRRARPRGRDPEPTGSSPCRRWAASGRRRSWAGARPTEVVVSSPTGVDDEGLSTGHQVWVVDVTTGERTELLDVVRRPPGQRGRRRVGRRGGRRPRRTVRPRPARRRARRDGRAGLLRLPVARPEEATWPRLRASRSSSPPGRQPCCGRRTSSPGTRRTPRTWCRRRW